MHNAIIDAATMYGASRYLRDVHSDPEWIYKDDYSKGYDRSLFFEFLHNILLYDNITLDSSSLNEEVGVEILSLIRKINELNYSNFINFGEDIPSQLLRRSDVASFHSDDKGALMSAVCHLISDLSNLDNLRKVDVPWAYKSDKHHDYGEMRKYFLQWSLPLDLLPIGLFAFRGICYSGFASYNSMTYLASPGRLSALKHILSAEAINELRSPRTGFTDLLKYLPLPEKGYSFRILSSPLEDYEISSLTFHLFNMEPNQALEEVMGFRYSQAATRLRADWHEQLSECSTTYAVGPTNTQSFRGNVGGNIKFEMNTYYQTYDVESGVKFNRFRTMENKEGQPAKQIAEDVKVGGSLTQNSDNSRTEQTVRKAEINEQLSQDIKSNQEELKVFGGSARGKIAIIALVIVLIAWFIYSVLT